MALMILNGVRPVKCRRHVASLQGNAMWCDCTSGCLHGETGDYAGGPPPKSQAAPSTASQCGPGAYSNEYD